MHKHLRFELIIHPGTAAPIAIEMIWTFGSVSSAAPLVVHRLQLLSPALGQANTLPIRGEAFHFFEL